MNVISRFPKSCVYLAFFPPIHCGIKKKKKAYFPLLSEGGGGGGFISRACQSSCSEIKRGRFASGNWHFILASKKFILFLFFFLVCSLLLK